MNPEEISAAIDENVQAIREIKDPSCRAFATAVMRIAELALKYHEMPDQNSLTPKEFCMSTIKTIKEAFEEAEFEGKWMDIMSGVEDKKIIPKGKKNKLE